MEKAAEKLIRAELNVLVRHRYPILGCYVTKFTLHVALKLIV